MFKKAFNAIIVGIDFSEYSKIVVLEAKLLSQLWNTKLIFVHAIHDPVVYSPSLYMSFPNIVSEESYVERIKRIYGIDDSKIKIIAKRGTPTSLLQEVANKFSQPLIMVGHRGHHKIADFFFGSTAQSLALKSKTPVWIHRGSKIIKPDRVLIPHDLSNKSNHSIDIIKKLSLAYPMNYEVYHVQEKAFPVLDFETYKKIKTRLNKRNKTMIENLLRNYPQLSIISEEGEVTPRIVKRTKNFDLLVMAHHNPTGLFSKSETADLLRQVKTPLLVVH